MFRCFGLVIGFIVLVGCGGESSKSSSVMSMTMSPSPKSGEVNVYTARPNCTHDDIHNCAFEAGIYVLALNNTSNDQLSRVEAQVKGFLGNVTDEVKELYKQKTLIIGIIEDTPKGEDSDTSDDMFALSAAFDVQDGGTNTIDGIELVYTDIGGADETTTTITYQKLGQLFDYYIDGDNNQSAGSELKEAYEVFLNLSDSSSIRYNQCNYGNGYLMEGTCPDDGEGTKGTIDPIHLGKDLNPGALVGSLYEYIIDPTKNQVPGELEDGFSNTGDIGKGTSANNDWSNPAFKPLLEYINKWLLVN